MLLVQYEDAKSRRKKINFIICTLCFVIFLVLVSPSIYRRSSANQYRKEHSLRFPIYGQYTAKFNGTVTIKQFKLLKRVDAWHYDLNDLRINSLEKFESTFTKSKNSHFKYCFGAHVICKPQCSKVSLQHALKEYVEAKEVAQVWLQCTHKLNMQYFPIYFLTFWGLIVIGLILLYKSYHKLMYMVTVKQRVG